MKRHSSLPGVARRSPPRRHLAQGRAILQMNNWQAGIAIGYATSYGFRLKSRAGAPPRTCPWRGTASRRFVGWSARARKPRGVGQNRRVVIRARLPGLVRRRRACQGAGRRARICRRTNPRSEGGSRARHAGRGSEEINRSRCQLCGSRAQIATSRSARIAAVRDITAPARVISPASRSLTNSGRSISTSPAASRRAQHRARRVDERVGLQREAEEKADRARGDHRGRAARRRAAPSGRRACGGRAESSPGSAPPGARAPPRPRRAAPPAGAPPARRRRDRRG